MNWAQLKRQQKTVEKIIRHAVLRHELSHAYLFAGPRGTGKSETAVLLAQMLFCEAEEAQRPCGVCRNCRRIASGNHPDVIRIRPDEGAQSIKKEQIALLVKEFAFHGMESARKIFILEEAEKLTVQAENSLLKFIEEPHPGTLAILITSQIHRLLDTILSRCQILTFVPLSDHDLGERLVNDGHPSQLATLAAGLTHNYTEAASLCQQEWFADAYSQVLQLTQRIGSASGPILPFIYDKFYPLFNDPSRMVIGLDLLLLWYRDLLHLQVNQAQQLYYSQAQEALEEARMHLTTDQTVQLIDLLLSARKQLDARVNGLSVIEHFVAQIGGIGN